jgi:hypothetical protein
MAKTYREKIASAKAAPRSLKNTKDIEVVSKGSLSKANKLIVSQAEKAKATKRNTGAKELSTLGAPKSQTGVKYSYEQGLKKAINAAIKQGRPQDVQRIRASQAVDISKTATRAKIAEMNLKKKKKK